MPANARTSTAFSAQPLAVGAQTAGRAQRLRDRADSVYLCPRLQRGITRSLKVTTRVRNGPPIARHLRDIVALESAARFGEDHIKQCCGHRCYLNGLMFGFGRLGGGRRKRGPRLVYRRRHWRRRHRKWRHRCRPDRRSGWHCDRQWRRVARLWIYHVEDPSIFHESLEFEPIESRADVRDLEVEIIAFRKELVSFRAQCASFV